MNTLVWYMVAGTFKNLCCHPVRITISGNNFHLKFLVCVSQVDFSFTDARGWKINGVFIGSIIALG